MLLIAAALLGALTVPLTGGRLGALADVKLRLVPAIFGALALQVVIVTLLPAGSPTLHRVLHVVSYGLAAAFLVANRRVPGMLIVAAGAALNLAAILANGGVMPAAAAAVRSAGMATAPADFVNSGVLAHPRLLFLGDVVAIPHGWPGANTYSIGDVLIAIGVVVVLHRLCSTRRTAPAASAVPVSTT